MASRILVVAFERALLHALVESLKSRVDSPHTARSSSSAFAILAQEAIDIVIVGEPVPRANEVAGIEMAHLLRERRPEIDVILIASTPSPEGAMSAIEEGIAGYLDRASAVDRLASLVDDIDERRRYSHEMPIWPGECEQPRIIGSAPRLIELYSRLAHLARGDLPILITGERGTGKTAVARAVHDRSSRSMNPLRIVECTSIIDTLAEAQLFGHTMGAFTDAKHDQMGVFALAGNGTIVLDEIADLPLGIQAKLLRVLQDRMFYPVGAEVAVEMRARVIAVTNRALEPLVATGAFRADLFDRLSVGTLEAPALRDRTSDVIPLAQYFAARQSKASGLSAPAYITPDAQHALLAHNWPGNVRELLNRISNAVVCCRKGTTAVILARDLGLNRSASAASGGEAREAVSPTFVELDPLVKLLVAQYGSRTTNRRSLTRDARRLRERDQAAVAVEAEGGSIARAAQRLGIHRSTLYRRRLRGGEHDSPYVTPDPQ